jgi:hypothetical protein
MIYNILSVPSVPLTLPRLAVVAWTSEESETCDSNLMQPQHGRP